MFFSLMRGMKGFALALLARPLASCLVFRVLEVSVGFDLALDAERFTTLLTLMLLGLTEHVVAFEFELFNSFSNMN